LLIHPALGVNRAVMQAECVRGACHRLDDGALRLGGCGRGRDVDRLFEKGTVQWVRLVEDRQHLQAAVLHHALERVFAAGNEAFEQRRGVRLVPLGAHLRLAHQRLEALERRGQHPGIIGAHYAAAPRQRHRLQHTGIRRG